MNYMEVEIQKYERRIKKITENPDPTRLRSNKRLFELLLNQRRDELEAWSIGKPFLYFSGSREEIFHVMGLHVLRLENLADRSAAGEGDKYLELARNAGYPARSLCDRLQVAIGMALSADFPPPVFVYGDNCLCDVEVRTMQAISHLYNAPYYLLDRYQEPGWEQIQYITQQLREVIQLVESQVPGAEPFDEEKLREIQQEEQQAQDFLREIQFELAKTKPCPWKGLEAFRLPDLLYAHQPGGLNYFREFRDEMKERVEKGFCAIGEEKARVMWSVTGPYYVDGFAPLERRGIAVPIVMMDVLKVMYGMLGGRIDWELDGRTLSPLEQEAELMIRCSWMGPAESWVMDQIYAARELDVDGVVYFMQTGCPTTLNCNRVVVERIEKELGIPVFLIEGTQIDQEKFDLRAYEEKLADFADVLLSRKVNA